MREAQERKGTVWTATAHIVSAVIGSGVLALAWSVAQLGWAAGPLVLLAFSGVTYFTSTLLADCYRFPDPISGDPNREYIDGVRCFLGPTSVILCGCAQYVNLWGTLVGYTITASDSMTAVKRVNCFHRHGAEAASCNGISSGTFMAVFGAFQLILSQLPSLENITWLSVIAVATSFGYSFVGLALCTRQWISHGDLRGTLAGAATSARFNILLAIGNVAFAYTFADVLLEIQGTLKSPPPENKTMKRASLYGMSLTTVFYLLLGCVGYAAFGNAAPGNILTGVAFHEPYWLVDVANLCVIVHLIGAYQVYAQPIFARTESFISARWPDAKFLSTTYAVKLPFMAPLLLMPSKLVIRTALIMFTTLVAMVVPFFNAVLGLIGALGFWPLTVYFPVAMHIARKRIRRGEPQWLLLQAMSLCCLLVSIAASVGSVRDIVKNLRAAQSFKSMAN